ncbi:MAG: AcrR family transcriptional regulator [Pseudohongiellaceae bacterium]|jgi:AcrR family transcriptional regulator
MMTSNKPNSRKKKTGRTYGGLSLEDRKSQRREQFLQAGLNVFGTTGFRSATVRSLCKEAQLTDRYFYESFGNLENLLIAVYEQCMSNLGTTILNAITVEYKKSNADTAIIAGLDAYFLMLENPKIARVCMLELEGISPEINKFYTQYINGFSQMLVALTQHAFPGLDIDRQQQDIIGISFIGAMRQSATNWLMSDYTTDRATIVSATSTLFLGILKLIEQKNQTDN